MSFEYLSVPKGSSQHTKMAVLCCLFQCFDNPLTLVNYYRFAKNIRALGLPLYTIECAGLGERFVLPLDGTVMHRTAKTAGWHKERLLNILAKRIPPRYTKLAWLDADVLFRRHAWAYETEQALDRYHVVQPFSAARWLDRDGCTVPEVTNPDARCCDGSIAYGAQHGISRDILNCGHPGFAWAMRRDTWSQLGGLCDTLPTMGSDGLMMAGFLDIRDQYQIQEHCDRVPSVLVWFNRASLLVQGSVSHVYGMLDHLWHGYWKNRQYISLGAKIYALTNACDSGMVEDSESPGDLPRVTQDPALLAIYQRYFKVRSRMETSHGS